MREPGAILITCFASRGPSFSPLEPTLSTSWNKERPKEQQAAASFASLLFPITPIFDRNENGGKKTHSNECRKNRMADRLIRKQQRGHTTARKIVRSNDVRIMLTEYLQKYNKNKKSLNKIILPNFKTVIAL